MCTQPFQRADWTFTCFACGRFQIKKLQGQLEGKQKNGKLLDTLRPEGDILENGMDLHVADLQSKGQPPVDASSFP